LMSKLMAQERVCRVTWNEINSDLTDKYWAENRILFFLKICYSNFEWN
jgi:hypothetical protein